MQCLFLMRVAQVDAKTTTAFPNCGTLYINVFELVNCDTLGTVTVKVWPGLNFWIGSSTAALSTPLIIPGEKVFHVSC